MTHPEDHDPKVQIFRLRPESDADVPLPRYMTPSAAGMDICAAVAEKLDINPGAIQLVPTGFALAIPEGFEAQIRPRSGLAVKHGLGLINSPGTIDSDYRGELKIALINLGAEKFTIRRGDRIAQMVINRIYRAELNLVEKLSPTDRDKGGFGHTGI
jgi:dUTP pyrophosphatase